jgi:hypothetical protein
MVPIPENQLFDCDTNVTRLFDGRLREHAPLWLLLRSPRGECLLVSNLALCRAVWPQIVDTAAKLDDGLTGGFVKRVLRRSGG